MGETSRSVQQTATAVRVVALAVLLAAVVVLLVEGEALAVPAVTVVLLAVCAVGIVGIAYSLFTVDAARGSQVGSRWCTSPDRFLIAAATVIATCTVAWLGWFRIELHNGHAPLLAFDERAVASAHRHPGEYHLMNVLNTAGIRSMVVLGAVLVVAALAVQAFRSAALLAASMAFGGGLVELLKTSSPVPFSSAVSWPSGHAAFECSLVFGVVMWWWAAGLPRPSWFAAFVVPVAVLIGYSRAFVGIHLFSEVIAGWAVGVVTGAVVLVADRLLAARVRLPAPSRRWPLVAAAVVVTVLFAVSLRPLRHFRNHFRRDFPDYAGQTFGGPVSN